MKLFNFIKNLTRRNKKMKNDVVNHPAYYTNGNIEVIDFIEDKGLNFHKGNAIKYIVRAGKKKSRERSRRSAKSGLVFESRNIAFAE